MDLSNYNIENFNEAELNIYNAIQNHLKTIEFLEQKLEEATQAKIEQERINNIVNNWNDVEALQKRIEALTKEA